MYYNNELVLSEDGSPSSRVPQWIPPFANEISPQASNSISPYRELVNSGPSPTQTSRRRQSNSISPYSRPSSQANLYSRTSQPKPVAVRSLNMNNTTLESANKDNSNFHLQNNQIIHATQWNNYGQNVESQCSDPVTNAFNSNAGLLMPVTSNAIPSGSSVLMPGPSYYRPPESYEVQNSWKYPLFPSGDPIPNPEVVYVYQSYSMQQSASINDNSYLNVLNLFDFEKMKVPLTPKQSPSPMQVEEVLSVSSNSEEDTASARGDNSDSDFEDCGSEYSSTTPSPHFLLPDAPPSSMTPQTLPPILRDPIQPPVSRVSPINLPTVRSYEEQMHSRLYFNNPVPPISGQVYRQYVPAAERFDNRMQAPNQVQRYIDHMTSYRQYSQYYVSQIIPPCIQYRPVPMLPPELNEPDNALKRQVIYMQQYLDPDVNPMM